MYCRGIKLWELMEQGKPMYYRNGTIMKHPNGTLIVSEWYLSDLDVSGGFVRAGALTALL